MLDELGLEQILTNILNLPNEDIQTVMNHYNTTDQDNNNNDGYIINIADGWGGVNEQSSSIADVRVLARRNATCGEADYDSG